MQFLFMMIMWLTVGAATSYLAQQRGRDPFIWFWIGVFLGIFGLLAVIFLPDLSKEEVKAPPPPEPEPDFTEWYYLDPDRKQMGPVNYETLETKITPTTYVWSEGMEQWKRAEEVFNSC